MSGRVNHAYRKVRNRLKAMLELYDFKGKSVLDLGCGGGYFTFELAQQAKYILAIDAEKKYIQNNQDLQRKRGISNVRFEIGIISPLFIQNLDTVDVTIFLSVLHHVIAKSGVYRANVPEKSGVSYGLEILRALSLRTHLLFFEMGQSDELSEWASSLPEMNPSPDVWIIEKLLKPAGFRDIVVIGPPDWRGFTGFIRKFIHQRMEPFFVGNSLVKRILRRITGYDTRDCRYMFMAKSIQVD